MSGLDAVPRTVSKLENACLRLSLFVDNVAVLIDIDWGKLSGAAFWLVSAMVGLPIGNTWVAGGSVPVLCTFTGNN